MSEKYLEVEKHGFWDGQIFIENKEIMTDLTEVEFDDFFPDATVSYDEFITYMEAGEDSIEKLTYSELYGDMAQHEFPDIDNMIEYGDTVLQDIYLENGEQLEVTFDVSITLEGEVVEWSELSDDSRREIVNEMLEGSFGGDVWETTREQTIQERAQKAKEKLKDIKQDKKPKEMER